MIYLIIYLKKLSVTLYQNYYIEQEYFSFNVHFTHFRISKMTEKIPDTCPLKLNETLTFLGE